jgi:uncharacterized damage-inducible protein DinB
MAQELSELLASQFSYVRHWTLMSCGELSDEQAVTIPAGAKTHILWELGHIHWTQEHMVTWGCAGGQRPRQDWEQAFGFGSEVSETLRDYPALEEVRLALQVGLDTVPAYVQLLSPDDLLLPPVNLPMRTAPTRLDALKHVLSHEAYHVGKVSLLRQMLGLKSVAELFLEHREGGVT